MQRKTGTFEGSFCKNTVYHMRSRKGIECLINLECMAYSAMTLLPYSDESFFMLPVCQRTGNPFWYWTTNLSQHNIQQFRGKTRNCKKSCALIKIIERYILSGFKTIQKL